MKVHKQLLQAIPDYENNRKQIERFSSIYLGQTSRAGFRSGGVVTIPCVVHIVYKDHIQNISDEQIFSQFTVLNQCFRNLDPDAHSMPPAFAPFAEDAKLEFKLAKKDPDGEPTSAITRTKTQKDGFSDNGDVKFDDRGGKNAWPSDKYFNIWVCNLEGGLLGYAQFPGGPRETYGVVITHKGFGTMGTATAPYDKGKTTVHEIGHCLNLLHIWGDDGAGCDGSDNVSDTPNQGAENYEPPTFPHISCDNGPNGDMFMNYMDYTNDVGMYMFTKGQIKRMDAIVNGPLASLQTSDVLLPAKVEDIADLLKTKGIDHQTKLAFDGAKWVSRSEIGFKPEGF
ncbi:MAG TPA: zinc metalloprotease [Nitrososphaeraceae archaeon]|nr:zinc metalloprotease [Nitrososphaeraceae archaeon]